MRIVKVVIGIVITAIIALVVGFLPIMEVPYTQTVQYQDTETYYEDEPYEAIETYSETEPLSYEIVKSYTDIELLREEWRQVIIGGVVFQDEVVKIFYPTGCVTLQNTDSVAGTVMIDFSFYALEKWYFEHTENFSWDTYKKLLDPPYGEHGKPVGESYHRSLGLNLKPRETTTAKISVHDINPDSDEFFWEFEVSQATKSVEMERTVTKYRQVEKERTVTKERPETRSKKVTLLDYLLHY